MIIFIALYFIMKVLLMVNDLLRVTVLLQLFLFQHFLVVMNWSLYILGIKIYFLSILKYVLICLFYFPNTLSFFFLKFVFKLNCLLFNSQIIILFRKYFIILIISFTLQYHVWILSRDFEAITFIELRLLLDRFW